MFAPSSGWVCCTLLVPLKYRLRASCVFLLPVNERRCHQIRINCCWRVNRCCLLLDKRDEQSGERCARVVSIAALASFPYRTNERPTTTTTVNNVFVTERREDVSEGAGGEGREEVIIESEQVLRWWRRFYEIEASCFMRLILIPKGLRGDGSVQWCDEFAVDLLKEGVCKPITWPSSSLRRKPNSHLLSCYRWHRCSCKCD